MKIALQGGHLSRTSGSTGTAGEQELTRRIRTRLSELLIAKGFQLYLFDADPPQSELNQDFDLFLSLHGDMDYVNDEGGGFADFPDPEVDYSTVESQRICKIINDVYFPETKIKYVNRSNRNTKRYYMWNLLSKKTPCVLIEMGQVQDPHDKVLLANTELIAGALSKAICKAFGVAEAPVVQPKPPVDPCAVQNATIKKMQEKIDKLEDDILHYKLDLSSSEALIKQIKELLN